MDRKFTLRSRLVSRSYKTEPPLSITYSNVVTKDSNIMAFMIYGMNNLDICACDIGNAYLNDPCQEKL